MINGMIAKKTIFLVPGFLGAVFFSTSLSNKDIGVSTKPVLISINSNYPPAIAFEEVSRKENKRPEEIFQKLTTPSPDLSTKIETIDEIKIAAPQPPQETIVLETLFVSAPQVVETEIGDLSREQAKRLDYAQQESKVLDQDWSTPSTSEIFVKKAVEVTKAVYSSEKDNLRQSPVFISALTKTGFKTPLESLEKEEAQKVSGLENLVIDNGFIVGQIEISDGLAFTNEHHIEVRRFVEGIPQEPGTLNLEDGTFKIKVNDKQGTLLAQLINPYGVVEGQGSISLNSIVPDNPKRNKITLMPTQSGRGGKVSSAYASNNKKIRAGAQVFLQGPGIPFAVSSNRTIKNDSFADNSDLLLQFNLKNHRDSVCLVSEKDRYEIQLLPIEMAKTLAEILKEQGVELNFEEGDALIYGQVTQAGSPIPGAKVQIDTDTAPIYFGSLQLPDSKQTETSDNGLFAFIVKNSGWNSLQVQTKNGKVFVVNALTYPGKVSQVFAMTPPYSEQITTRTFDAFSGQPLSSTVSFQQTEEVLDVDGSGVAEIALPKTEFFTFAERTQTEGYLDARHFYNYANGYLHFPMVKETWINQISALNKINQQPSTTTIIGFVQEDDFELLFPKTEDSQSLVYFNSQGEVVDRGVAGGGFLLFNQPHGGNEYSVISMKTRRLINRVAINDPSLVSILNFSFR